MGTEWSDGPMASIRLRSVGVWVGGRRTREVSVATRFGEVGRDRTGYSER